MDLQLPRPLRSFALFLLLLRRKHFAASIIVDTVQLYPLLYLTSRDTAILSLFDACSVNVSRGSYLHEHTPSVRLLLTNAMDPNEPSLPVKSHLGVVVIATTAFVIALDTAALGTRLWSRRLQGLSLCFNDYAVLFALVCTAMRLIHELQSFGSQLIASRSWHTGPWHSW